jgi:phage terminase small subunit
MAGRKPKPPRLKAITGNPGRRPIPEEVELPDTGVVVMPEFMKKRRRAVELWEEMAPKLVILGTLRPESVYLLAQWCMLQSQFERRPDDFTASKIANMRALASMLGMDPSSQGKFVTTKADDENKDPAEEFFRGPRAVND